MYLQAQSLSEEETRELRRAGGAWLKSLREAKGLSQRGLAALVEVEYYTFISQLERGGGRVPPDRYELWASALDVEPRVFVKRLMRFYDPVTHRILFPEEYFTEDNLVPSDIPQVALLPT